MKKSPEVAHLESSYGAEIPQSFKLTPPESIAVLDKLLNNKRSQHTRRAYRTDITDFFYSTTGQPPTSDLVLEFLHLEQEQAVSLLLDYKASMIARGLREATVNRRLSAMKALATMGRKLGVCRYTLEEVEREKNKQYRDTTGISVPQVKKVLEQCDRSTPKGKRDYALLRLLWDNALRRGEICQTNLEDFDPHNRTLRILGKGRGTDAEFIDLSQLTIAAILDWLQVRGQGKSKDPLFIALDSCHRGNRLSGEGLRLIVSHWTKKAGITKKMSPHRMRHSAITAALDATGGDVRRVQKLSRHAKVDTLMIYDDNRQKVQKDITDLLSELV